VLASEGEEVTHSLGPDAHEHLHERGGGAVDEWDGGLPRDGPGEEGLPRARKTREHRTPGNARTGGDEFFGFTEERHDFLQFSLCVVDALDVGEAGGDFSVHGEFLLHHGNATTSTPHHAKHGTEEDEEEKHHEKS
jgi:hypothetical protein